jgi:hypothetical protein
MTERPGASRADAREQAFDLNIEKVLEHWTVPFAIRELIANALDEEALTGTAEPAIFKDADGIWHVADGGRGVRYEHLTQNENAEKRSHPQVIGQFGMGLKDAVAVFNRRGISVEIRSAHADISTGWRPKDGFPDIITLHALVSKPSDSGRSGTDILLRGVKDDDVATAKRFFLRYSGERLLESTEYGDVLARTDRRSPARVYVKGLFVAEEPNFLFSYNVTKLSAVLRRALNRERSNVGRGAYTDRVKAILTACRSTEVAGPLAEDLDAYTSGRLHDELSWREVALHACRVLQTNEKVIFVTAWQMAGDTAQLQSIDAKYIGRKVTRRKSRLFNYDLPAVLAAAQGRVEASAEYLAEDRSMADISRLLEADGLPPPLDLRAYTATLRLGFWVAHVLRAGSLQFIERVSTAGPAPGPCLLTIWPTQNALTWPPRSLATIGGLIGLARSIDNTGIAIVENQDRATVRPMSADQQPDLVRPPRATARAELPDRCGPAEDRPGVTSRA